MAANTFPTALRLTLVYEGGKADHPADPGGRTNQGVTQRVYSQWRRQQGLADRDVWLMTPAERDAIYRARYWEACGGTPMPAGVDYAVFDFAVNSGVARAVRTLQTLVDATVDGAAGPQTVALVHAYVAQHGGVALVDALCTARLSWLRTLPTYATFGRGWRRRVMGDVDGYQATDTGVVDRAADLAMHAEPTAPTVVMDTPKTYLAMAA